MVVMPHIQMVEKNHLREIALLPSRAAADVEFSCITPMQLPEALRAASQRALRLAADPLNKLDDNPYIGEEWRIISIELKLLAMKLENRFDALFFSGSLRQTPAFLPSRASGESTVVIAYREPRAVSEPSRWWSIKLEQAWPMVTRGLTPLLKRSCGGMVSGALRWCSEQSSLSLPASTQ
jgi:hypothetical protein